MSVPLIKKLGSWRKVCEHIANQLGFKDKDYNNYIDWMMKQENLSPSNYEKGLFFDSSMYRHLFRVYQKLHTTTQMHVIVDTGKTGKGKSTLGLQQSACINPEGFCLKYVCYIPSQFFRIVATLKRGDVVQIDEGDRFFSKLISNTSLSKDLNEALGTMRCLGCGLIVCFSKYNKVIDTISDDFVDTIILKTYNPKAETEREKFRGYIGFTGNSVKKIHSEIKNRRKTIYEVNIKNSYWKGVNSDEIPNINDINAKTYNENKEKYVRERFLELSKKYELEEQKNNKENEFVEDIEPLSSCQFYKVSQVAKITGKTNQTIHNWINSGVIPSKRIGKDVFIPKEAIDNPKVVKSNVF